ncbi:MAG: aspartate carbamoyltransferase regulatory subunit [Candidatus Thermoplasmatota archaeon]|jgi:aspartate carbamoyltransferase regulatory subunit|nr:aspartate carbamoyltransferase regulatory subunit [Candidatus Thermoplasmatota archaeon]
MDQTLKISKIKDGTVIDHIPAGKSLKVLSILNITGHINYTVSLGMFVQSKTLGFKDVVKIESRFLERDELDRIALVAPEASISKIRNYEIVEKFQVNLTDRVTDIIKCSNQNCISNTKEPIKPEFIIKTRKPLILTCIYCDREMFEGEILSNL